MLVYLETNHPSVDDELVDALNMTRFNPLLTSLMEIDPINLIKLLQSYGPVLEELAGEEWPFVQLALENFRCVVDYF